MIDGEPKYPNLLQSESINILDPAQASNYYRLSRFNSIALSLRKLSLGPQDQEPGTRLTEGNIFILNDGTYVVWGNTEAQGVLELHSPQSNGSYQYNGIQSLPREYQIITNPTQVVLEKLASTLGAEKFSNLVQVIIKEVSDHSPLLRLRREDLMYIILHWYCALLPSNEEAYEPSSLAVSFSDLGSPVISEYTTDRIYEEINNINHLLQLIHTKLNPAEMKQAVDEIKSFMKYSDSAFHNIPLDIFLLVAQQIEQRDFTRERLIRLNDIPTLDLHINKQECQAQPNSIADMIRSGNSSPPTPLPQEYYHIIRLAPPEIEFVHFPDIVGHTGGLPGDTWFTDETQRTYGYTLQLMSDLYYGNARINKDKLSREERAIQLFKDTSGKYYVSGDGRHRVAALKALQYQGTIIAEVRKAI